jgi:molybdenum cofactor cytidylyltransferase
MDKNKKPTIGIVILAAGESRRMGQPKQLLKIDNQTLIRRTIDISLATDCRPVVLVVGANKAQIVPEIIDLPITVIDNPMWHEGMSSSVKIGMAGLWMMNRHIDAVLMLVCDQPHLSVEVLEKMIDTYLHQRPPIVACKYQDQVGVPVLLDRSMFDELLTITGDRGAKSLVMKYLDDTHIIDFEDGIIDLDTPQNYQQYLDDAVES